MTPEMAAHLEIIAEVIESAQYENPTARQDLYNRGLRDAAVMVRAAK